MRRLPGIVLFILLMVSAAQAQQFTLRQYTSVDGLPQSQVNAIVEDSFGYLWIGTSGGGLARFDGREFKVYTTLDGLLSNIITSLFIDSRQNIWIAHPRGITRFDGLQFKKFQPSAAESQRRIRRVVEFNDTVFMVSNPGVIGKIYHDSVYYWAKPIFKNKLIFLPHVTADKQICFYMSDSSFVVTSKTGFRKFLKVKAYNIFNHGKEVWVDTDSGSFALNLKTERLEPRKKFVMRHIIGYDTLRDSYWTRDERTLFREYLRNGQLKTDTVLNDIPITQILADAEGNTWMGSAGNGLFRYYTGDFIRLGSPKLGPVMAIEKDKSGNTWVGASSLKKIRGDEIRNYSLPYGDDDGVLALKVTAEGTVWIGSQVGLGKYDEATDNISWFTREHGLSSAFVTALDLDDKGKLWIGTTGGGLNYFDGKNFSSYYDPTITRKNISSLRFQPFTRSVYFGTEYGLHVLQNEKISSIPAPEFENTTILSLSVFRDSLLLIGSGGGGVAVAGPDHKIRKLIGPREGLPSGFVFFVAPDETDRIWVGTEKGITRIKLDRALEITETRDFGFDNGLTGIETNQNAYYLSPNEKYFGLIDGLYSYNGSDGSQYRSFGAHITDIEIQYGEISSRQFSSVHTGFFKIPDNPAIPSDRNHITFRYNRVDKRYPNSVRYKYFLKNFDKTWSQPTEEGRVTYGNIPPGTYEFMVMATNKMGSWDSDPVIFKFSVKAPFYQTSAFYFITGGLFLGSLALFILIRIRKNVSRAIEVERIRQEQQASLRKEIARDFHDEMGNQLTRIINYVSLMRLSGNGHGPELYTKVEESAKYLYNGTRDFIWAIDPVNDDLSKLFLHVRDFGEKLFEEKGIHFRAYNENKEKIRLPYGFSREANLIFKEAMTNAFKHSGAQNVSFYLKAVGVGYEMGLEDDGVGLEVEKIKISNGIKNIRTRAEKIQSSLVIEKIEEGKGTRVLIKFSTSKKKAYDSGNEKTRSDR